MSAEDGFFSGERSGTDAEDPFPFANESNHVGMKPELDRRMIVESLVMKTAEVGLGAPPAEEGVETVKAGRSLF